MRKRRRLMLGCVPLGAVALFVAAASVSGATTGRLAKKSSLPPIDIAYQGGLSGAVGAYTVPTLHGEEIAIAQINKAGGVAGGRKLSLSVLDDQGNPSTAADDAHSLVDQKNVLLTSGLIFGPEASAALPVFNAANMPTISFDWTAVAISVHHSFRVSMDYSLSSSLLFHVLKKLKNVHKVVIWASNDPGFTTEIQQNAAQIKAYLGVTPDVIEYPLGTPDFSSEVLQLYNYKPDLVYDEGEDDAGIAAPMKGTEQLGGLPGTTWVGPTFIIPGSTTIDGPGVTTGAITNSFVDFAKPQVKALAKKVENDFHEPLSYGQVQGYDAMYILAAALNKPGAAKNRGNLFNALQSLRNVPVVAGPPGFTISFYPGTGTVHDAYRSPKAYLFDKVQADGTLGPYNGGS